MLWLQNKTSNHHNDANKYSLRYVTNMKAKTRVRHKACIKHIKKGPKTKFKNVKQTHCKIITNGNKLYKEFNWKSTQLNILVPFKIHVDRQNSYHIFRSAEISRQYLRTKFYKYIFKHQPIMRSNFDKKIPNCTWQHFGSDIKANALQNAKKQKVM